MTSADQALINTSDESTKATTTVIAHSGVTLTADSLNPTTTVLYVGGTAGNDTILINPATRGGVTVTINGKTTGPYNVTGRIEVHGWEGNDVITVNGSSSAGYKLATTTIKSTTSVDQLFACLGYDWFWDLSGKSQLVGRRAGILLN